MITAPGVVALAGSYHGILLIDPPPPLYAAHIVQDRQSRPCAGAIVYASRAYCVGHGVATGYPHAIVQTIPPCGRVTLLGRDGSGYAKINT